MSNGIDVTVKSNVKKTKEELEKAVVKALEMIGLEAEGYAKVNITNQKAVDTGALRNSITHVVDTSEQCVYVGTNIEYAPYIELGTGIYVSGGRNTPWSFQDAKGVWHRTQGQKPRPYLVPAVRDHKVEYAQIAKDILGNSADVT